MMGVVETHAVELNDAAQLPSAKAALAIPIFGPGILQSPLIETGVGHVEIGRTF